MRAGCVSGLSNDVFISGSYDHTVKVWDARKVNPYQQIYTNNSVIKIFLITMRLLFCIFKGDGSAFMTLDHGSPVEDVALLPNDALLVSAGGHDVKVNNALELAVLIIQK